MDFNQYLQLGMAFILVLGLMGLFGFLMKKLNHLQSGAMGKNNRLRIIEQRMIDPKSKAVLLQCDTREYLVMTSPTGNIVLEAGMKAPKQPKKEEAA